MSKLYNTLNTPVITGLGGSVIPKVAGVKPLVRYGLDGSKSYYLNGTTTLGNLLTYSRAGTATQSDGGVITSVAANVLRREGGLAILEGSATNLVTNSNLFTNFLNGAAGQSISVGGTVAGLPASEIMFVGDTSTNYRFIQEFTPTPSTNYVFSIHVGGSTGNFSVEIDDRNFSGNRFRMFVDVSSGVTSALLISDKGDGAVVTGYGSVAVDGGWRSWVSFRTGSSAASSFVTMLRRSDAGTYRIAGRQYELGTTATSYIPTNGTAVTRQPDIMYDDDIGVNVDDGFWVYIDRFRLDGVAGSSDRIFQMDNGVSGNRLTMVYNKGGGGFFVEQHSAGTWQAVRGSLYTLGSETKIAVRFGTNKFAVVWPDGTIYEDTTCTYVPPTRAYFAASSVAGGAKPTRLAIGSTTILPASITPAEMRSHMGFV